MSDIRKVRTDLGKVQRRRRLTSGREVGRMHLSANNNDAVTLIDGWYFGLLKSTNEF